MTKAHEKRQYPRAVLTIEDGVIGRFYIKTKKQELQTAYILNISEDGLFFTLRNDEVAFLNKDDILCFLSIKVWGTVQFVVNIEMKIIWIGRDDEQDNIGVGCKFTTISSTSKESIKRIVEHKRKILK